MGHLWNSSLQSLHNVLDNKKLDKLTEGESIVGYQVQVYYLSLLKY